jgi:PAS domain S-box-containing protein
MVRRFGDQLDRAVSLLAVRADDLEREVTGAVSRRLRVLVILGAGLSLGVVGLSLVITRSVTSPLRRLARACERVHAGDLYARMGLTQSDELGSVSLAFDGMVAELARSRAALAEAEERYRSMVAHLPALTWTATADRRPTYVSANIEQLLGYTVEEFYANPTAIWPGRVHPDDAPAMLAAYDALFDEGRPFEIEHRMQHKNGSWIWVQGRAQAPYEKDGARYADGMVTDITVRKRMEQLITDSERHYRLLAENTSDVIWTCDLEQRPTYVSPSVAALTGFGADEVKEKGFGSILTPASLALSKKALEEALASPPPTDRSKESRTRTLELEHVRRDGSTVWTEARVSFLLDQGGRRVGIIGVSRDLTERKQVDRMREDFVAFTMHQLRTPLAGIKWMLELADQSGELPEEARSFMDDARASAERLIGLVNNLLAAVRLEHGRVSVTSAPIDLAALSHDVLKDVAPFVEKGRLAVSVEADAGVGLVESDPVLIRQAVMNLVGNAITFTPAGGSIGIRVARDAAGVRWEIRDSGIGIPKEEQGGLFQKFYRAESTLTVAPEGTGLGLYMVSLIVKLVGGTLGFASEAGQGSTFFFTIPASTGERT